MSFLFDNADVTLHPKLIFNPCLLNSFKTSLEILLSAIGKNSSMASSTVTSEPSLDQTLPSSNPITPAPIIPNFLGTESNSNAPVLSTISLLLISATGILIGDDPVAMTIFFVSRVSVPSFEEPQCELSQ